MVKMVLGSSDTQASSVASLADNYTSGFNSIISAIENLANADGLEGEAYTNVKNYGSTVVTPLAKGFILLADAAKTDTQLLPDRYRSDVGSEDLDEDTLTAQIDAYQSTIDANNATLETMEADDPNKSSTQSAVNDDTAEKGKLEEKLRKLREYDAASSGFFDDISDLESNINTGLSQLQTDVAAFNGTFTIPSKENLQWADSINENFETYTNYQSAIAKAQKGEELTEEEARAIEAYQKQHPGLTLDKSVVEAKDAKLAEVDIEQSAQELADEAGISYSEALDWLISGEKPVGISENAVTLYDKYVTYKGEMRFINGRQVTVDAAGRVKIGGYKKPANLYNRDTGRVYVNRRAKKFKNIMGEEADIRKTDIGRGVRTTGWKNALGDAANSAKSNFKSSLKVWDDFNWKDASKLTKVGKTVKGLGAVGTVLNIGGNIKENFFDDKSSSVGEKIRNFVVDQGVDTVSGAGSAAAGAAIGTMIGGPVGTVVGAAAGIGISMLMEQDWFGGKSATDLAKDGLKSATNAIGSGFKKVAGWFS
ncbi:T7SS effector LXG polymorphic toxin [Streptococcus sp. H31]|uniref:T7SS effector LXG polymorphic toxin n=1 Tax=Streptococcus huangxiaojuni TaxID=3237239 RepID=UPI0034A16E21